MVLFNYSTKELTAKIVYYGPGLCGKTTNLQFIHRELPETVKGKMLSLATKTDRTLFFDFLPLDLGEIRGMKTRVQLYTVPGQVFYNETRKLVLKGADGIVFVADSQAAMLQANVESFKNLEENLKGHGMRLSDMPLVLQFNKRDLPRLAGIEELNAALNRYNAPFYESVATTGIGVQDTLKAIVKLVLVHLTRKYDPQAARTERPAPAPAPVVPFRPPAPAPAPAPMAAAAGRTSIPVSGYEAPPPPVVAAPVAVPEPPRVRTAPPPPPDFRGTRPAVPLAAAPPSLEDAEIDALVEEVRDERAVEPLNDLLEIRKPAAPAAAAAAEPPDLPEAVVGSGIDWDAIPLTEDGPQAVSPSAMMEDLLAPLPEPAPQPAPAPAPLPARAARPSPSPEPEEEARGFEVDRGFDPDYTQEIPPEALGAVRPGPAPEPAAAAATPAPSAEVRLERPAAVSDLFADPELDVARLAFGEPRTVVVPVELGEGAGTVRAVLRVTLRLDRADGD